MNKPTEQTRDETEFVQWHAPIFTLQQIGDLVGGEVVGDSDAKVRGIASIEDAVDGDIVFAENERFLAKAEKSHCIAIVIPNAEISSSKPLIKVENARFAFLKILERFNVPLSIGPGVHPSAVLGREIVLGEGVRVGPNVVLADFVNVGDGTTIMGGSFIGEGTVIGEECLIHANVTVNHGALIGDRVILHSGCVIGSDGFGYLLMDNRRVKVPQVGIVVLEDDVEVGAGSTIDRAKTGSTKIGARTKIDNLVHIAHNVKIGTDCVIVAQVGIAGSSVLGNSVIMAGQSGAKDHVTIGDNVVVMGRGAVFGDIEPGQVVSGYPARPHMQRMRVEAAMDKMPETRKRLLALEKVVALQQEQNEKLQELVAQLASKLDPPGTE